MRQSILVAFCFSAALLPAATLSTSVQCGPLNSIGTSSATCSFSDAATNISVEANASYTSLSVFGIPGFNPGFPTDPFQAISGSATASWEDELRIDGLAGLVILELSLDTSIYTLDNNLAFAGLEIAGTTQSLPNSLDPIVVLQFTVPTSQWFAFNGFLGQNATASNSLGEQINASFGIRSTRLLDQSGTELSGFQLSRRSDEIGAIPEPSTFVLAGAALLGVLGRRRVLACRSRNR